MANKLILVPESIYRGLTTSDVGEPNLDFARRELDKVRRSRAKAPVKNIRMNQELRRYLVLRNERENRPVKVQMVSTPAGTLKTTNAMPPASILADDEDDGYFWDDSIPTRSEQRSPVRPDGPYFQSAPSQDSQRDKSRRSSRTETLDEDLAPDVMRRLWAEKSPEPEEAMQLGLDEPGTSRQNANIVRKKQTKKRKRTKSRISQQEAIQLRRNDSVASAMNAPLPDDEDMIDAPLPVEHQAPEAIEGPQSLALEHPQPLPIGYRDEREAAGGKEKHGRKSKPKRTTPTILPERFRRRVHKTDRDAELRTAEWEDATREAARQWNQSLAYTSNAKALNRTNKSTKQIKKKVPETRRPITRKRVIVRRSSGPQQPAIESGYAEPLSRPSIQEIVQHELPSTSQLELPSRPTAKPLKPGQARLALPAPPSDEPSTSNALVPTQHRRKPSKETVKRAEPYIRQWMQKRKWHQRQPTHGLPLIPFSPIPPPQKKKFKPTLW